MVLLNLAGLNTEQSAKDTLLLLWLSISSRHLKNSCSASKDAADLAYKASASKGTKQGCHGYSVLPRGGPGNPTQSCQASKVLGTLHLLMVGTRADVVTPQEEWWFSVFWAP